MIEAAIWFCDLRGFTGLADRLPALEVVGVLDRYFECVSDPVAEHGGEVLKLIGDAALAIFPVGSTNAFASTIGDSTSSALAIAGGAATSAKT